jgi:hypothetical protein
MPINYYILQYFQYKMDKVSSKDHKQVALKKSHPDNRWSVTADHLVVFFSIQIPSWGTYLLVMCILWLLEDSLTPQTYI